MMLHKVGVLTLEEKDLILDGLEAIWHEIEAGDFTWSVELEDVHMNIESALTARIGSVGKKLHTGRSRNDQVATDIRLYVREQVDIIVDLVGKVQIALVDLAERRDVQAFAGVDKTAVVAFEHLVPSQHMMAEANRLRRL